MRVITATSSEYTTRQAAIDARKLFLERFRMAFPNALEIEGTILGRPGHYVVTMIIGL